MQTNITAASSFTLLAVYVGYEMEFWKILHTRNNFMLHDAINDVLASRKRVLTWLEELPPAWS